MYKSKHLGLSLAYALQAADGPDQAKGSWELIASSRSLEWVKVGIDGCVFVDPSKWQKVLLLFSL